MLKNKTALITGSSKGLGFAMTLALAKEGANIVAIDRGDITEIKREVEALGRSFHAINADLSVEEEVVQAAKSALSYGTIDILVNNAGVTIVKPTIGYGMEDYDLTMNVNVKAVFLLSQIIGEQMILNQYGKIINVASIQGLVGTYENAAYVASKHAIVGLTKSFANDWGKYGINVNAIAPGFMITDNTKKYREIDGVIEEIKSKVPLNRWGTPDDLAGPIVFLASDASKYVNGHTLVVDGGFINI